jgi:hypothetical protein
MIEMLVPIRIICDMIDGEVLSKDTMEVSSNAAGSSPAMCRVPAGAPLYCLAVRIHVTALTHLTLPRWCHRSSAPSQRDTAHHLGSESLYKPASSVKEFGEVVKTQLPCSLPASLKTSGNLLAVINGN